MRANARAWQVALLVMVSALAWQWLIVTGYFEGHWSALFVAGDRIPQSPPVKAESSYVMRDSYGYDGQLYHAIAHDPFDLHGTDRFMDNARVRYSRIFVSAVSYGLGFGQLFWVDRVYRAVELLCLFLGVLCTSLYAQARGLSPWFGTSFVALPGAFISLERELLDLPLCAFLAAAILCENRQARKPAWVALASAGLVREMGLIAIGGFALEAARERKFRQAAIRALAAMPALLWYAYVFLFVPRRTALPLSPKWPILPLLRAAAKPQPYPYGSFTTSVLHGLDFLAIAGALAALALGLWIWIQGKSTLACIAGALTLFGIAASAFGIVEYSDVYSFGRQSSPLLLTQLLEYRLARKMYLLCPLALMLPRALVPGASMTWHAMVKLLG